MKKSLLILVLLVGVLPAHASFIGETVILQKHWPNLDTLQYQGFRVVGDGNEFVFDDNDIDTSDWQMDIGENTITVESLMDEDVTFNAHTFNGWELLDAFDGFEDIISVSLGSSNVEGLDNSMIDFGPDIISLNWAGLDWNTDSMFVLNVLFASDRDDGSVDVSAPSVFGMVSLAIIGFLIRERRLSVAKR